MYSTDGIGGRGGASKQLSLILDALKSSFSCQNQFFIHLLYLQLQNNFKCWDFCARTQQLTQVKELIQPIVSQYILRGRHHQLIQSSQTQSKSQFESRQKKAHSLIAIEIINCICSLQFIKWLIMTTLEENVVLWASSLRISSSKEEYYSGS